MPDKTHHPTTPHTTPDAKEERQAEQRFRERAKRGQGRTQRGLELLRKAADERERR